MFTRNLDRERVSRCSCRPALWQPVGLRRRCFPGWLNGFWSRVVHQSVGARFVTIDCDTPLILPPNLRDWVPVGHLAHFILDVVEEIDLRQVRFKERGTGSEQYPPRMLLALLLYCYATGLFSSRRIEQASWDSVPVRLLCGDTHPDHDTIRTASKRQRRCPAGSIRTSRPAAGPASRSHTGGRESARRPIPPGLAENAGQDVGNAQPIAGTAAAERAWTPP